MKFATILRHRGLTLAQYGLLRAARTAPIHRVGQGWRLRGSRARILSATVERVAGAGLIAIDDRTAVLTDAGARLLADVEGRR